MLNGITARTPGGSSIDLSLTSYANGYLVQSVDGLDPVKASISSSPFADRDGDVFQSARREARNIVITVALVTDYATNSVRKLRNDLYKYFTPKSEVQLYFRSDDNNFVFGSTQPTSYDMRIDGTVESFENDLFSAEPQIVVSILCHDPDFTFLHEVQGAFDWAESRTADQPGADTLIYKGSVPTGFEMIIHTSRSEPARAFTNFTFSNKPEGRNIETITVNTTIPAGAISAGFDSRVGRKSIQSNGVNALYGLEPNSVWPKLYPGVNQLRLQINTTPAFTYGLQYIPRHGGY